MKITKYIETTKYDNSKSDDFSHEHKTKVICLTTGNIFNSIKEAAEFYNIKSENGISYCCSYRNKTCNKLQWMYLDEYKFMKKNNLTIDDMKERYNMKNVTKKVVCLNNGKIFNSIVEANKYAKLSIYSGNISQVCQGKRTCAGKDKNNQPLLWAYYEDYISLSDSDILNILNKNRVKKNRKIICINTKQIFDSVVDAMIFANLKKRNNIYSCCSGNRCSAGKHPITKEPLKWMYYDDYKESYKEAI